MVTKSIVVVFLDGVGLGAADPEVNPFMHVELPVLQSLLGVSHVTLDMAGTITDRAALLGLDARLGVKGLPQSATGQTTILTGQNAPAAIGKHYGPYPDQRLRAMLDDSIFSRVCQCLPPPVFGSAAAGQGTLEC
jgi:hypothetical protein